MLRPTSSPTNGSAPFYASSRPPLRVFASGTVFNTQKIFVPVYPEAGGVARAQNIQKTRGGHGANVLGILAQFHPSGPPVSPNPNSNVIVVSATGGQATRSVGNVQFCGPLPGNDEGELLAKQLEGLGVGLLFSFIREGKGVPTAWVIQAADGTKTVINHNPLPDMSHEEFVSRLGPVLAPENYDLPSSTSQNGNINANGRRRSGSGPSYGSPPNGQSHTLSSPYAPFIMLGRPPFDWMHFEGRSPHITHSNMAGLDGLARERGWRNNCVFSLQIGRAGTEMLMHSADVIFFSKPYAMATHPGASPREFLISMCTHAAPHALLIADWSAQGAALLSVPTREYLQSSGWVEPTVAKPAWDPNIAASASILDPGSVKSGSGFWADGRLINDSNSSDWRNSTTATYSTGNPRDSHISATTDPNSDDGRASIETERGAETYLDEVGAHEAFVAGMIFALCQKILPGRPYTRDGAGKGGPNNGGGRWKLEECLRFATELAGRKGRRNSFANLRTEMESGGWIFE
ncbi:hypothetical protein M422DRAFT_775875 [Sphaerobolus stellatus SS14]|nr:hypothetical protein M422DRAFT_775875 [Sphaerobolus stellatus SS14]